MTGVIVEVTESRGRRRVGRAPLVMAWLRNGTEHTCLYRGTVRQEAERIAGAIDRALVAYAVATHERTEGA